MNTTLRIIMLLMLLNISPLAYSQGKLDKSKDDLKKGSDKKEWSSDKNSDDYNYYDDDDDEGFFSEFFAQIFMIVTYYTAVGSYEDEAHLHNMLTEYPFTNDVGNYEADASGKTFRFDVDSKGMFGVEDIYGNHLKMKLRPTRYFYLQGDYTQMMEAVVDGDDQSYLSLFNLDFCYDRIRFEKFNLGWTFGMKYVANDVNRAGVSGGINTDIFLFNSMSLYSSMRWGAINNVPVNQFETQLKFHRKKFMFSVGYENLRIGTPTYNFATIGVGGYF